MAKIVKKIYFRNNIFNNVINASCRSICLPSTDLELNVKFSNSDMLYSLRQSTVSPQYHAPLSSLAGDPKKISECCHTIRSAVFEKWNRKPKRDNYNDWLKYSTL